MFVTFLQNAATLIVLCLLQRGISIYWKSTQLTRKVVTGALFGTAAIAVMLYPAMQSADVIFDARSVVLSVGSLLGGPIVGVLAAILAGSFRLWLGGEGAVVGLCVIVTDTILGLIAHHYYIRKGRTLSLGHLIGFGFLVHFTNVAWFYFLPATALDHFLSTALVPYVLTLTAATVGLVIFSNDIVLRENFTEILKRSEDQYKRIFDGALVSIWEEDLSDIYEEILKLRERGVTDFHKVLDDDPKFVELLASKIRILQVNQAALQMFEAQTADDLRDQVRDTFGSGAIDIFKRELIALWDGRDHFQSDAEFRTLSGKTIFGIISVQLPKTIGMARRVPVTILDISSLKSAESQILSERRRLQEIIWGTRAATWEWDISSGAIKVNERWAEMIGYSIEELEPISIATWQNLSHPDDLQASDEQIRLCFSRDISFYESEVRMRHKDGKWIWVSDRGRVVEWRGDKPVRMAGTHLDVTLIKNAELSAQRLALVRETVTRCHRAIAESESEEQLFREICQILVQTQGYALVWVGIPQNDANKSVQISAKAGENASYLDDITVRWGDDQFSKGPTGTAIRTAKVQIVDDILNAKNFAPWAKQALGSKLNSSISLPLIVGSHVVAALNIYSSGAFSFDELEVSALTEFSLDVSAAIRAIRLEADKSKLDEALRGSSIGVVRAIAATIEKRDPYTAGHQERVAQLSVQIARRLGFDENRIEGLRLGAMIHDIGKIYIPAEILNRPGHLTSNEFGMIKSHPEVGRDIVQSVVFPWPIAEMISQHHERIDGTGYPLGLKGDEIAYEAKIIAVADVVEAITSHRPYRPALGIDLGLDEIRRRRGTSYAPEIVDSCLEVFRDGFVWGKV